MFCFLSGTSLVVWWKEAFTSRKKFGSWNFHRVEKTLFTMSRGQHYPTCAISQKAYNLFSNKFLNDRQGYALPIAIDNLFSAPPSHFSKFLKPLRRIDILYFKSFFLYSCFLSLENHKFSTRNIIAISGNKWRVVSNKHRRYRDILSIQIGNQLLL